MPSFWQRFPSFQIASLTNNMSINKWSICILGKPGSQFKIKLGAENVWGALKFSAGTFNNTEHQNHHFYFIAHAQNYFHSRANISSKTSLLHQPPSNNEEMNPIPRRWLKFKLAFTLDWQRFMKSIITAMHSCFRCRKWVAQREVGKWKGKEKPSGIWALLGAHGAWSPLAQPGRGFVDLWLPARHRTTSPPG